MREDEADSFSNLQQQTTHTASGNGNSISRVLLSLRPKFINLFVGLVALCTALGASTIDSASAYYHGSWRNRSYRQAQYNMTTPITNPGPTGQEAAAITTTGFGLPLYVDPNNEAAQYAGNNPSDANASIIGREGNVPVATWFGDWNADVQTALAGYATAASRAHAIPVAVLYNIPFRDCGSYSSGGAASSDAYLQWVRAAADGIGDHPAIVILEPDALAGLDCLSQSDQSARYSMLAQAVSILKSNPNTLLYVDAGNPAWQTAGTMANRLLAANVAQADGFSLNVSNYRSTADNQVYGDQISALTGGKHYVIDTSRNGNGNIAPDAWCNNFSAALGTLPTTNTGDSPNDALLWIKIPWESDGACDGAPSAGQVYWAFAVQMARNAGW